MTQALGKGTKGMSEEKRLVTLRTDCTNQEGNVVLTEEATVKYVGEA